MPPAGRLGDKAQVPADSHGCPGCPHPAIGPAIDGSGNVNINGQPALRVGDKGVHAACCGPNTWEAVQGAPGVFINGRAAHRMGDPNQHCGGAGKLVEGSSNVLIGNFTGRRTVPKELESSKRKLGKLCIRVFPVAQYSDIKNHTFTLTSTDECYHQVRVVRAEPGEEHRHIDLLFTNLDCELSYSLEVEEPEVAKRYPLFEGIPYDDLAHLSSAEMDDDELEDDRENSDDAEVNGDDAQEGN